MFSKILALVIIFGLILGTSSVSNAAQPTPPGRGLVHASPDTALPDPSTARVPAFQLEGGPDGPDGPANNMAGVERLASLGSQIIHVSVTLDKPSLASLSDQLTAEGRVAHAAEVLAYQDQVAQKITTAGGKVIYKFRTLSSGLIVEMPGKIAPSLAQIPEITRISQIFNYQVDLTETVPYIGADVFQTAGYDGSGVKVAVLDSGIDYTHLAFAGAGTVAAWEAEYYGSPACKTALGRTPGCANSLAPNPALIGPLAPRVKGGRDFVGPVWDGSSVTALSPDSNPIANRADAVAGDDGTHGTHVADIIGGNGYPAGVNADGAYPAKGQGVAPGVDLYAFTVCSSVSTACSGVAIMEGLDAAGDLDNNPATKDPADVINLSLGAPYGQPESDDVNLVNELTLYGSIVVVSAGNSGDRPYIVGSPSMASGSISVAQTTMPSETFYPIQSTALLADIVSISMPWGGPILSNKTGLLAYDTTSTATRIGCSNASGGNPYVGTPFTGKVLLVDRGTCAVSLKVANGQTAGAIAVVIANNAPSGLYDLPPSFSYGGGTVSIPALTITQPDGVTLKTVVGQSVTIPASGSPLNDTMASTSSRGPRNHDNMLKPDIGAPGASVSAVAATGAHTEAFGGTSGAAPMIAGSVALLKDFYNDEQNFTNPTLIPQQYKALLMNTANTMIYKNGIGGYLAPVSRIGAGQVDLATAFEASFIAWDSTAADPLEWTGSMSFSYQPVTDTYTATRQLTILNLSPLASDFNLDYALRYADDIDKGVTLSITPAVLSVPGDGTSTVDVTLTIALADAATLPVWPFTFNRGSQGYNGYEMDQVEVDGYIQLTKLVASLPDSAVTVPFHVLPKAVADVAAVDSSVTPDTIMLTNSSLYVNSYVNTFALVDQSPNDFNYTVGDCASVGEFPGCNSNPGRLKRGRRGL